MEAIHMEGIPSLITMGPTTAVAEVECRTVGVPHSIAATVGEGEVGTVEIIDIAAVGHVATVLGITEIVDVQVIEIVAERGCEDHVTDPGLENAVDHQGREDPGNLTHEDRPDTAEVRARAKASARRGVFPSLVVDETEGIVKEVTQAK